MKFTSLRTRLLLGAALSILIALALAGLSLGQIFTHHVASRIESELDNHLRQIAALVELDADGAITVSGALPDPRFELPFSGLYWQVQETDTVVATSPSLGDERLDLSKARVTTGKVPICIDVPGPRGREIALVVRDVTVNFQGKDHKLRLAAAIDHSEIDNAVSAFRTDLAISLGVLAACLIAAAWAQVAVGLKPMHSLRKRLAAVQNGLENRLAGEFPDEVRALVVDLNSMIDSQERSIVKARARAGDLAHGLKTPLTALNSIARDLAEKGDLEVAREISNLAQRMQNHVGREIARTQIAGRRPQAKDVLLRRNVEQLVKTLQRAPRGGDIEWNVDIDDFTRIAMDRGDLHELLGSLLENALKWTKSRVRVVASGVPCHELAIEDDGPGVPEEQFDLIMQRGAGMSVSRDSAGLGLAIADDIAEAYGYRLVLFRSRYGGFGVKLVMKQTGAVARSPNLAEAAE